MEKPVMKKEVAVRIAHESVGIIYFYSTRDAVGGFEEYGNLQADFRGGDLYTLTVDARYDFSEVLSHIENYG